jgi:hypothetical protein
VARTLASIDLLLLCAITLSLALLETPVPRRWALAAVALVAIQTAAMHAMGLQEAGAVPPPSDALVDSVPDAVAPPSDALVHSVPEAIAALAVPALTAALLTVIFFHCARAYAQARRRLEEALRAQAMGKDMPTG